MLAGTKQTRVAAATESSMESRGCFSLRVCFLFMTHLPFYLPETGRVYALGSAAGIYMPQSFSVFFLNRISTTIS